ncbi:hypothetical protein [Cellulomonas iranensis]|uniref:hypothetical protein n=1 Tax=Cellulomonas iranensis TaxID=76862 RepID=UPI00117824F3|nr:hypothetical protein [Cellulomonas iranensis]
MSTSTDWMRPDVMDHVAHDELAAFTAIVESIPAGRTFTVNDLRDRLDAAAVPAEKRGVLFTNACRADLIEPVRVSQWGRITDVFVPSSGSSAHRARVRLYRRLPVPGAEQDGDGS